MAAPESPLNPQADRAVSNSVLLAENSIKHAMMALACMRIGTPVAIASPSLVANAGSLDRFSRVVETLMPGAVYAGADIDVNVVLTEGNDLHASSLVQHPVAGS